VLSKLFTGQTIIDVSSMSAYLHDVAAGGMRVLKREQEGFSDVTSELAESFATYAGQVGVAQAVYDRFLLNTSRIQQLRAAREIVDKLAEVLEESEAKLEDEREADIGIIVSAVRKAAQLKDASLLAPFEKTIRYHGQVGLRAMKTRRKNAAAEAEAQAEAEAEATRAG
jgi:hypothetical protein